LSRPLRISEEVDAEAGEASRWYDAQRAGLGEEFLIAIDKVLELIEANPDAGSRVPGVSDDDVRRILVRRFPLAGRVHSAAGPDSGAGSRS